MAKIYARQIYKGKMTIDEVPVKYQQATRDAYFEIYGIELE